MCMVTIYTKTTDAFKTVYKSADQQVVSSTDPQTDEHLTFEVGVNKKYLGWIRLLHNGSSNADMGGSKGF